MKQAVIIFLFSFFVLYLTPVVFAQGTTILPLSSVSSATPSPTLIEYTLPYPGLLPDSPLYGLKTLRDRIMLFLIADPIKKAEFDLLQANKRVSAGMFLAKKKQYPIAVSTISKGENYFEDALSSAKEAQSRGVSGNDVVQKQLSRLDCFTKTLV